MGLKTAVLQLLGSYTHACTYAHTHKCPIVVHQISKHPEYITAVVNSMLEDVSVGISVSVCFEWLQWKCTRIGLE